jgi:hypothetical protein
MHISSWRERLLHFLVGGVLLSACHINPRPIEIAPDGGPEGEDGAAPGDGAEGDHCTNGVRDGDESDVDCGGSCPRCAAGKSCVANTDCQSGSCRAAVCAQSWPLAFAPAVSVPVGPGPAAIIGRDFDGDNIPDLIVICSGDVGASTNSSVSVLHNHGKGTFTTASRVPVSGHP